MKWHRCASAGVVAKPKMGVLAVSFDCEDTAFTGEFMPSPLTVFVLV